MNCRRGLEYTYCISYKKRRPVYDTKLRVMVKHQFQKYAVWSVEGPFIAITLRSTLTRSDGTCEMKISGSNIYV